MDTVPATSETTCGESPPTRRDVLRALDNCYDPCCRDRKISVVDMGLIENIAIEGRHVDIQMILTSGWCPFTARLFDMIHHEVETLPTVDSVDVEVVWNPTWSFDRMSREARDKLRLPLETLRPLRETRLQGESA
ncbi:MAG: metal-sulfur cluster assembly factor [Chloroflexota bacterium]